jgi:hypothetical protein
MGCTCHETIIKLFSASEKTLCIYSDHTVFGFLPLADSGPHFADGTEWEGITGDWRPADCEGIE